MSIGNDVVSSDFLKVLLALKDNIMRDLHCNDIGIVVSTSGNECVCKLLSNPDIKISCTKINNIITDKDDVVFIAYTDINSKHNAKQLSDQKDLRNQTIGNKHAYENAVIVLNYSKQGSGEGVTVDSAFSTTSTNALQNKVITNRFNQVESRLINVDSALSATSTNPVQNKVLYDPVVFAESERQKSKNLLEVNNGLNATNLGLHVQINNNIITVDGAIASGAAAINIATFNPKIYAGKTYTLSFKDYSNLSSFDITTTGTRNDGTQRFNMLNLTSSITNQTITADVDYELKIEVYAGASSTISGTFKLQLEEGSVATEYQPYNGAIVHEKQLPKITTLWTNPNPSNDFSSQTIALANDNYDYAIMICAGRNNELNTQVSFFFEKGTAPILNYVLTNTDASYSAETICRRVYHTNNTTLNIQDCYYSLKSNAAITANNLLIPYKVIGIKIGD